MPDENKTETKNETKAKAKPSPYADPGSKVTAGKVRVQKGAMLLDVHPSTLQEHLRLGWSEV